MHLDTRSRPKLRRTLMLFAALTAFAVGVILAFVPFGLDNINPDSSLTLIPVNGSQGGRVNGLKVDPSDNQIAYAASEWGGIFKTEDGADTWTHLDGHLPQATFDVDVGANGVVYATSLFDFVRRAMPHTAPKSLTNDQVYALTAYILHLNGLVGESFTVDRENLPTIEMPARPGPTEAALAE